MKIPFNKPHALGNEFRYLQQAIDAQHLAGDGAFSKRCHEWLCQTTQAKKALLTHSCTAALEMSALLVDLAPGDEVIMPSYTFVSTANAVALRGAVPVFVDVRPDTMNLDEKLIEAAITKKTKSIFVVHYAGVACEMDEINAIAARHDLVVVEDDAQGLMSTYKGRPLGALGSLAAVSFHETKNVISGEGGALLINDLKYLARAEILWQKGTNRQAFFRGEVDKYSWVDIGSSFLPSELTAAFLWAQLEQAKVITEDRMRIWKRYHAAFESAEREGRVVRPTIPAHCEHNAHMYYLMLPDLEVRTRVLTELKRRGVYAVFHYVPLHSSPAGRRLGRVGSTMSVTDEYSDRIARLPLWMGMASEQIDEVIETVLSLV